MDATLLLGSTAGHILVQVALVLVLLGGGLGIGVLVRRRLGDDWVKLARHLGLHFEGGRIVGERAGLRITIVTAQRPAHHGPRVAVELVIEPRVEGEASASEAPATAPAGWTFERGGWRRVLAGAPVAAIEALLREGEALARSRPRPGDRA